MSKRSFLRKTALGFAATASVCLAADGALAQTIDLNGGTFNAHGTLTDGGLNARYWHQNLLSVFTGPVSNPPPGNTNNFKPSGRSTRPLNSSMAWTATESTMRSTLILHNHYFK